MCAISMLHAGHCQEESVERGVLPVAGFCTLLVFDLSHLLRVNLRVCALALSFHPPWCFKPDALLTLYYGI